MRILSKIRAMPWPPWPPGILRDVARTDWRPVCNENELWHATCLDRALHRNFLARSSKEADVVRRRLSWISWRPVACAALALAAAGSAIAQQPDEQKRVTTIDHAVELYISDDALEAQYVRTLDLGDLGPVEAKAGILYNEDRDLIGVGDLLMNVGDDVGVRALEVRVGTRVYGMFLAPEDQDVFSIGVGGEAQYFIDSARTTSVTLGLFYAPDIATFGQADNVKDVVLRFMTRLRNGTDIFVGYRSLEVDIQPQDREVDDNLHLGFRRSF